MSSNDIAEDRRNSGGFWLTVDELGDAAVLTIDLSVFDKAAVFKAAYWATGKAFLYLFPTDASSGSQVLRIEVRPKSAGDGTAEHLAREISNSLIDFQTRQLVLRETSGARDAILRRAFGEGHKHLDPDTLS